MLEQIKTLNGIQGFEVNKKNETSTRQKITKFRERFLNEETAILAIRVAVVSTLITMTTAFTLINKFGEFDPVVEQSKVTEQTKSGIIDLIAKNAKISLINRR